MESKPRVAIIGAGLAGLSAAYHLCKLRPDASITIYESAKTPGGRILTHTTKPYGEHGGEYLLSSELSGHAEYCLSVQGGQERIRDLLADLKVETDESAIPSASYFWDGRYYRRLHLNAFLDRKTAAQIRKIFSHAQKATPHPRGMFKAWLNSVFSPRSARMPRSEERGGMAARSEAEAHSLLVYKSPAWKGGVLYLDESTHVDASASG